MRRRKKVSKILKERTTRKEEGIIRKFLRFALWATLIGMSLIFLIILGFYLHITQEIPKISSLTDYNPPVVTTVYSENNQKIAEFYKEYRIIIPMEKIPPMLKDAFISAEDSRFYKHKGVDLQSIVRAFIKNIEAGSIVQGGSTITQQVTKSFLLTPEKSYKRKINEAILAYKIDKTFSKDEILYLYLNQIYFGNGAYGVEAAAEKYFGKSASELNLAECALLAGLPQAPSRYSPYRNMDKSKQRQIYVLDRMLEEGYITKDQLKQALDTQIEIKQRHSLYMEVAPYFSEYIRQYLEQKYGQDALYKRGFNIYTTCNIDMQIAAREALRKGLQDLDKRHSYRGPVKHLGSSEIKPVLDETNKIMKETPLKEGIILKAVVTSLNGNNVIVRIGDAYGIIQPEDMKWAIMQSAYATSDSAEQPLEKYFKAGDLILVKIKNQIQDKQYKELWAVSLEQEPNKESALLCIEAKTGYVKAMVGGYDFAKNQFNRAIQSKRQPGSAFKPIIYAAAIDNGFTPASVLIDSPITYENSETNLVWKPKNYDDKFNGRTLLRDALAHSRNVVTIKILKAIGVDYAIKYARNLGITSELSNNLSLALGSSGVSLFELVRAYSVFANQGCLIQPTFIERVVDRDGKVLEEAKPSFNQVIEKNTAYIMTSLLRSVVAYGTGKKMLGLNRPVVGKTGTTNDLYDAWFIGYSPEYITGVWVGSDELASLGRSETGAVAAGPIWFDFMQHALADKPVVDFPETEEGIEFAEIDAETGLLAIPESQKAILECFKEGTAPTEYTPKPGAITETEDFFKSGF
ncbi:MAG: PBP1A family penicillin-binding protein [Proteobacteria bacterium]|nr:PBP1A family penicillin-binding protein [Pseudomonadota bacterium]MBU4036902.1 PBP1A family penicillin-binding protein [Pseudomonadota bacterium]